MGSRKHKQDEVTLMEKVLVLLEQEDISKIKKKDLTKDGHPVGRYLNEVRLAKDELTTKQVTKLEEKGMTWDANTKVKISLNEKVLALLSCENLSEIKISDITEDGIPIGNYLSVVRNSKDKLSNKQIIQLEEKGIIWSKYNDINKKSFDEKVEILIEYGRNKKNNINDIDEKEIKEYLKYVRSKKDRLSKEQIKGLRENGVYINPDNDRYLSYIYQIKKWVEENKKIPVEHSQNNEENAIARQMRLLKKELIDPYINNNMSKKERDMYREEYPVLDDIIEDISDIYMIYGNSINKRYVQVMQMSMTHEQKASSNKNKEVEDAIKSVEETNNSISMNLRTAISIKMWMNVNNQTKPPRIQVLKEGKKTVPEEEARLGKELMKIIQNLINPFIELETEEQREEYRIIHPEIDEVMEILLDIYKNVKSEDKSKLVKLMQVDLKKRRQIEKAKQEEYDYEQQLENKRQQEGSSFGDDSEGPEGK